MEARIHASVKQRAVHGPDIRLGHILPQCSNTPATQVIPLLIIITSKATVRYWSDNIEESSERILDQASHNSVYKSYLKLYRRHTDMDSALSCTADHKALMCAKLPQSISSLSHARVLALRWSSGLAQPSRYHARWVKKY